MRKLLEVLKLSSQHLENAKIENARRQAEELIADALRMSRLQLYLEHDRPLQESELAQIRDSLARRAKGEPNAYIRGYVEFHDCEVKVTRDVLIPRQETALLVDLIIQKLRAQNVAGKTLFDLCTGSGYIGIALKKRFPELTVVVSDICPKALAIARENAREVEVEFLQGDLLEPFKGRKADFLVCNPPYISEQEFQDLDREVKEFEPRRALVAGPTGLEFYERLQRDLPAVLAPTAEVWFEIGHTQGTALSHLFPQGHVLQDLAGKDRFYFFSLENE